MKNITRRDRADYPRGAGSHSRKRVRIIPMQSKRRPLFGCVPTDLCRDPLCHDLRPFEITLLATVTSLARLTHGDVLHNEARDGGREAIELELKYARQYQEDWDETRKARRAGQHRAAPERYHVVALDRPTKKPGKLKKAIRAAGRKGYSETKEQLRKRPLPNVTFQTTRSLLLHAMGMAAATRNRRSLDDALEILTKPIRIGDTTHNPLLSVEALSGDKIILTVSSGWLDPGISYQRVPLPLPTKSTVALRLLLWLVLIKPKSELMKQEDIRFEKLCGILDVSKTPWVARQAIHRALDVINFHYLRKLDHDALRQSNIRMPGIYEIKPVADGDRVAFFSHQAGTYKYDQALVAHRTKTKGLRKRRRKPTTAKPPVSTVPPPQYPARAFEKWLELQGYPARFDFDEMPLADRQEFQALRRQFEKEVEAGALANICGGFAEIGRTSVWNSGRHSEHLCGTRRTSVGVDS